LKPFIKIVLFDFPVLYVQNIQIHDGLRPDRVKIIKKE